MSTPETQKEENFHNGFIRLVRKHFHFLELPGEAQFPWMLNFYESIYTKGLGVPSVACGYFDVFFRIDFSWEPWSRWLGITVNKLPIGFGYLDRATAQVKIEQYAPLDWMVALANPAYKSQFHYQAIWLEEVEIYLRTLSEAMQPVVSKLLSPHRHADRFQEPDFPFFDEVAALDLESFKARLTPAQLEGSS